MLQLLVIFAIGGMKAVAINLHAWQPVRLAHYQNKCVRKEINNKAVYMASGAPKHLYKRRRNGQTDRQTDRRTDRPSYRDARIHLTRPYTWHQVLQNSPIREGVTDLWTDGPMDGRTNGRTDQQMDRWMDLPSYRDAWTHLKR